MKSTLVILIMLSASFSGKVVSADSADVTRLVDTLVAGNHIALMRHAIAPGTGDPDNFDLRKCDTQRNLDAQGRAQAQLIGQQLGQKYRDLFRVFSSQWCRCLETAKLLDLGVVTELPVLNSFFQNRQNAEKQTQMLAEWLSRQTLDRPMVLVTHQVNITAISGVYPSSGEIVLMHRRPDGALEVVETLKTGL